MDEMNIGDTYIYKEKAGGQGCLILFGLPFFLAGGLIIVAALGYIPMEGEPPPLIVMIPFGSIFALVGLGFMLGRSGVTIDAGQETIVKWYGLIVPMKTSVYRFDQYNRVILRKEIRKNKNSTTTFYPVGLEGDNVDEFVVTSPTDYQEARSKAERVAKLMKFSIADRSSGGEVVRDYDKLDESIRDHAKRTGEVVELPYRPANMRSKVVSDQYGMVAIDIPPPGFTLMHKLQLAAPLIFISFFILFFLQPLGKLLFSEGTEPLLLIIVCIVAALFLLIPILLVLRKILPKTRKSCRIKATRDMLTVEKNFLGKKKVTEIPARELEELEMGKAFLPPGVAKIADGSYELDGAALTEDGARPDGFPMSGKQELKSGTTSNALMSFVLKLIPGPEITARSDRVTVQFGKGLDINELRYIHAAIKKVLTE